MKNKLKRSNSVVSTASNLSGASLDEFGSKVGGLKYSERISRIRCIISTLTVLFAVRFAE